MPTRALWATGNVVVHVGLVSVPACVCVEDGRRMDHGPSGGPIEQGEAEGAVVNQLLASEINALLPNLCDVP